MFSNKQEDWRRLLDDVTHRQIDTVVADAIQGTSLDHPIKGLGEIATEYAKHLRKIGAAPANGADKGDKNAFVELQKCAKAVFEGAQKHSASDHALAGRIERRSARLAAVAERIEAENPGAFGNAQASDVKITVRDRATISATWELGTAPIAMQSVISLDGDLVTRVSRAFSDAEHAAIHQIHSESVTVSLSTWEMLVAGIGSLARSFVR